MLGAEGRLLSDRSSAPCCQSAGRKAVLAIQTLSGVKSAMDGSGKDRIDFGLQGR